MWHGKTICKNNVYGNNCKFIWPWYSITLLSKYKFHREMMHPRILAQLNEGTLSSVPTNKVESGGGHL